MKSRNLLFAIGAATLIASLNIYASDALLSPRAAGNQIKTVAATADTSTVSANSAVTASPRAIDNEIKTSMNASSGAAVTCRNMTGSPKAVAECASHPGAPMPCCAVTAME